ncbi:MAG: thiamine diphosphokinase [Eubacterium sp.]|nr:thiamine diphosphokinase [Eubacterium sp.]
MSKCILVVLGGDVNILQLKEICGKTEDLMVIAADRGLEALDEAGICPDIIMGDYDSVRKSILDKYRNRKMITFDSVKDFTDGEAAVIRAIEETGRDSEDDCKIVILGATGNRPDHTMANLSLLKKCCDEARNAVVLTGNSRIRLFKGPADIDFYKNREKYDYISLLPLGDSVSGVNIKGFKYDASDLCLVQGSSRGISNELSDEVGRISFLSGYLMIVETVDQDNDDR